MPRFSSKHIKREQVFRFDNFNQGYTEESAAAFMDKDELSTCKNLKYVKKGNGVVLKKRQGTTRISRSVLPSSADVLACTYYINQSQYILATAAKIYYLDSNFDPVEIGTIEGIPTFTEFNSKLIIHDGEATKFWDGTNFGIIHRSFYDELLATGDGSETEFSGTLLHPTIIEYGHANGTALSITFTDTTAKTITDAEGVGRLTGDVASSWVKNISDVTDSGGLCKIDSNAHGFSNGDEVNIQAVVGTGGLDTATNNTLSNPTWTVSSADTNDFELTGSTFAGAYTSGGTISKNTIIYTTGAYVFKTDGAPDNTTLVEADYEEQDGGEESSAGFVRGSRLYLTGCPEHPSRLYYTEVNDEKAVDTSAGGGYVDIDPDDGDELMGGINFETSILLGKENSLHRIDDYPGDATFKVEKITDDLGIISHRTHWFEGNIVSFLSNEGWVAMHPSERYGDIQKGASLSTKFKTNISKYSNSYAYSLYNPIDKQLWLSLSTGSGVSLGYIYVVNLETGGQVSIYKFVFGHSCFGYANGEVLIGGVDGHLYKLGNAGVESTDNGISYSEDTTMKTSFEDWGMVFNWKHNKEINVDMSSSVGVTADLNIYKNEDYETKTTIAISIESIWDDIYSYSGDEIYDSEGPIGGLIKVLGSKKKFDYHSIMFEIDNISGKSDVEIRGINLRTAIMGDK